MRFIVDFTADCTGYVKSMFRIKAKRVVVDANDYGELERKLKNPEEWDSGDVTISAMRLGQSVVQCNHDDQYEINKVGKVQDIVVVDEYKEHGEFD